jgi:asparagine synthase (glutamine-hydrolysing)
MCGICGFVASSEASPGLCEQKADAALAALHHRGPDGHGQYRDGRLWLGHARLSILDLSDAGSQPMATPSGRFVISYNGELYNYRELAAELKLENFRSHSDTEVVLKAFELLGAASFRRLNGIFAIAVYDRQAQKIWLARDRMGVKPLYYRQNGKGLFFASEIKAITALADDHEVCDLSSLHEWLYYGNTLGERTLYQDITQLLPGHYLELDLVTRRSEVARYWSLEREADREGAPVAPPSDLIAETRRLLEQAVRRQLVSDVPVGVFLSGGVDSSAITAFASKHYGGSLATYSAGFDDQNGHDERPRARRTAAHFGTDHHELQINGSDVAGIVETMVHHHDGPFSDAANIPLYLMASQISGRTKVVLQGDGGDEVFGGYRRYVTLSYYSWLHPLARVGQYLNRFTPGSALHHRAQRYLHAFAAPDLASTMALLLTSDDAKSHPASVFRPRFQQVIERSDPFARYRTVQGQFRTHDIGNQMSLVDLMIELPDVFLEKVDRATMAAGMEVRVPFLDNDLVGYVARIPGTVKMPWGRKKWLLKQAVTGIVPDEVLNGPKLGFNVPFGYWLRTSLKSLFFDHLTTFTRAQPDVLDTSRINEMYATYAAGQRDRSFMLWKLLNFMIWCNRCAIRVGV